MAKVKRVLIVCSSSDYYDMFLDKGYEIVTDITKANLVCFTGGSDVSPSMYGEEKHPKAYNDMVRDTQEANVYKECISKNIPMVGVCRGGQFLNVMNGGKMYQHVTNHTGNHNMYDVLSSQTLMCSSTHHQMMRPSDEGTILAFAKMGGVREHMIGQCVHANIAPQDSIDPEVVFYKKTQSLCFQPHPEFMSPIYDGLRAYFFNLLNHCFQ